MKCCGSSYIGGGSCASLCDIMDVKKLITVPFANVGQYRIVKIALHYEPENF